MAIPSTDFTLTGLALRLVRDGYLAQEKAEKVHQTAVSSNRSFFTQLLRGKSVDTDGLARLAAEEFGIPLVNPGALDPAVAPVDLVEEKIIRKHQAVPIYKRGTKLYVAVADPTNPRALEEIKFHTGLGTEPILASASALASFIDAALHAADASLADLADESLDDIDISSEDGLDTAGATTEDLEQQIDTPIVRFVNKMLLDAINRSASDIHMEPYENRYRVRYRVDGVLYEVTSPPYALAGRLAARVKILSRLDIAERRVPQDGRMKLRLSRNRSIDFRVSTLPTLFGEKVVIRLLDSTTNLAGLEQLGLDEEQQKLYAGAVERPYGMILVTGPTGSGKTVSLYTALKILNTAQRNISTVEDPVEINLPGINQVHINEKAGLTFAAALRAFLRQDPDVIMVGEVRDLETADIAIKASQTGHLVLSTLHTNDAPSTLTRLLNMGVAPFNIASAVHLIMAQRLVRRLCQHCRSQIELPTPVLIKAGFQKKELDKLKTYQPKGCDHCTEGYRGRIGLFQVMPLDEEMGNLIMQGGSQVEIEQLAGRKGVTNLRRAGLNRVADGSTSLAEVERVTNQ